MASSHRGIEASRKKQKKIVVSVNKWVQKKHVLKKMKIRTGETPVPLFQIC